MAERMRTPWHHPVGTGERDDQESAVHRAVKAILTGRHRMLRTMATGTGKTVVAFQTYWKRWNGVSANHVHGFERFKALGHIW
jgi:type I restriction enzyme R subunit